MLVERAALGTAIEFERDSNRIEVRLPAEGAQPFPGKNIPPMPALGNWSGTNTEPKARADVLVIQISVIGVGPVSASDFDGPARHEAGFKAIKYCDETLAAARAVAREVVEWTRIHGQSWLSVHAEEPQHLHLGLLFDEDAGRHLPVQGATGIVAEVTFRPAQSAVDARYFASLGQLLGSDRPSVPVAESLLADALHFSSTKPVDLQWAVLLAAIACELKVKEALETKVAPQLLPMVLLILQHPRDWSLAASALYDKATSAALGRSLKSEDQPLYKRIETLFQMRNEIAHYGGLKRLGLWQKADAGENAKRAVDAAPAVFKWLDNIPAA
jgi:hypothetical protein